MGAWWVRERWVVVSSFRRGCTATNSNCRPSLSLSLSTFSLLLSQLMHHWLLHNISLSLFHSFSLSSTACTPSDCWRPKGNAKKKSMIIINFFFLGLNFVDGWLLWWLIQVLSFCIRAGLILLFFWSPMVGSCFLGSQNSGKFTIQNSRVFPFIFYFLFCTF